MLYLILLTCMCEKPTLPSFRHQIYFVGVCMCIDASLSLSLNGSPLEPVPLLSISNERN